MKLVVRGVVVAMAALLTVGCSKDDMVDLNYKQSFVTKREAEHFINRDGSVTAIVKGAFEDTNPNSVVVERGFVYGLKLDPEVTASNTVVAKGVIENAVVGEIKNLEKGKTYYVRGYFKMQTGTFFYGKSVQVLTPSDMKAVRKLALKIEDKPFFVAKDQLTPTMEVTNLLKESPVTIGFEYSEQANFSGAKQWNVNGLTGNIQKKKYQAVIKGLKSATTYYIKPFAIYADGTKSYGGTNTGTFKTN